MKHEQGRENVDQENLNMKYLTWRLPHRQPDEEQYTQYVHGG